MLSSVLSSITISNGFNTDLGLTLQYGPPAEAASYDQDSLYWHPLSKRIEPENKRWIHHESFEITAVKFTATPAAAIQQIEQDVWGAIGRDPTLSGQVHNLLPGDPAVEYEIATQGKVAVLLRFRIDTLRKTNLFEP